LPGNIILSKLNIDNIIKYPSSRLFTLKNKRLIEKKVKVIKIKGIKMKDGVKQKSETYWYNPDTGIVYDFDLDYQIGRVKMEKDEKGMNTKIATKIEENNEVYYVIEEIINIPSVRII
jgi:hypothetical protein